MADLLEVRQEERILHLTLNRPEKRNALSLELSQTLVRALDQADGDRSVGVICLGANGPSFCAGMDLDETGRVPVDTLHRVHEALFTAGTRVSKPIVAAVNGPALAGGTGLVANAHILVARPDATFGLTEIRIGLWPVLVFRAVALAVGERRALEMSLTGRIVHADDAREMGLVHEIAESPEERAREIAGNLARMSGFIIKNGMSYVQEIRGRSWQEAGQVARRTRTMMLQSPDFAEGLAAFREKRDARWNVVKNGS